MRIRKLTPTECERLQGFPDGWTDGVSETQRYKTLGNAVTVNVVQAIVEKLLFTGSRKNYVQRK
jgi:DNA (cytosine-5)-methyltransferase 1